MHVSSAFYLSHIPEKKDESINWPKNQVTYIIRAQDDSPKKPDQGVELYFITSYFLHISLYFLNVSSNFFIFSTDSFIFLCHFLYWSQNVSFLRRRDANCSHPAAELFVNHLSVVFGTNSVSPVQK